MVAQLTQQVAAANAAADAAARQASFGGGGGGVGGGGDASRVRVEYEQRMTAMAKEYRYGMPCACLPESHLLAGAPACRSVRPDVKCLSWCTVLLQRRCRLRPCTKPSLAPEARPPPPVPRPFAARTLNRSRPQHQDHIGPQRTPYCTAVPIAYQARRHGCSGGSGAAHGRASGTNWMVQLSVPPPFDRFL